MKNIDYNSLLMYISLILAVAILISILFGCTYRRRNGYREYFSTPPTPTTTSESSTATSGQTKSSTGTPSTGTPSTGTPSGSATDPNAHLSASELKLKNQIQGGQVSEQSLQQLVDNNRVTTENLRNIIQAFQNELNLK